MTDTAQLRAQAPYKQAFVRLGRRVWFTLESSHRADPNRAKDLGDRIEAVGSQLEGVGDFSTRRSWKNDQWDNFLQAWKTRSMQAFQAGSADDTTPDDEKKLCHIFDQYWMFYVSLAENPENVPKDTTMESLCQQLEALLMEFEKRLGDPTAKCDACGKCAFGRKRLRCSRCKGAFYCSQECQKVDWKKGHKRVCKPIDSMNPKELQKLVTLHYRELRRQGMDAREAMRTARMEFGLDKQNGTSAGKQVAAMFGMM
mmetsp:Transcript_6781/g.13979  ORF Transcript_6781/g.13979 Transcript_6781/m.13979 type:complete len:256 (-) Transcript_6781:100-867(-)